ncbi:MAG TPA: acyl-CoA dehydrogenase family protein [Accumulibacter sp.]|uniref:acyl-CoA dehydrogenase family protein n=1 Tax=Accumulibacter sp. TaxID=2053492 RepID=UPI0025E73094|nr:acyl-CoA dehydrogenase family protein [Accumulibacter sp.]MCM8597998.1 acyl-CoA/acyl-ACP dehydrogenase [Accumulibacter sp.]MCM8661970.1 acyl-CoA/acyl-ACP dehydrogenase [Accumulibacter sp.]HNC51712.1 acyl-CoA dehydrogenase family protein [Accumulibacter sp.]
MTEVNSDTLGSLQYLESADAVLRQALTWVKRECAGGKGVSNEKLDEHQMASFDLAWCAAESTAARFAVEYARQVAAVAPVADGSCLEERMARVFCAEALQNIHNRLRARPQSFGLDDSNLAPFAATAVSRFCQSQLDAGNLESLGREVIARNGASGAYMLDDHATMMQDAFRKLATNVVMPLAEEIHREDRIIPPEILDQLTEMGCFGLSVPERYGGLQSDDHEDNTGMIVVTEELSRGSLGAAGSLITRPEILSRALLKGGTEEQRQKWLPLVASGQPLCAIAVTEPDTGSDVAAMRLKATKCEGGWLLDGVKTWCTMAGKAGVLLVLARSNPDRSLGHKGLSMFLVEKDSYDGHDFEYRQAQGGVLSGRAISTIGYRGMHSYEVFFDNVFVPDENLVGGPEGEGKGFYFTMAGFAGGRIQTAARAIGVMQAAFERAVSYSQERKAFGKPIGEFQLTLVKLARMATLLTVSRQFTYAVGRLMDQGLGQMEASMVKLFTCRTAEWLTREAMQIHGGMGYAEESPVSRYFLDARVLSIFEGAEETLALKVIARSLIDAV